MSEPQLLYLAYGLVLGFSFSALVAALLPSKKHPDRTADFEARETAETALAAIARLREELSALRGETHRDRDELRGEVGKHERAIVRMGTDVQDAVNRCMAEATKIAVHVSPTGQRKIG